MSTTTAVSSKITLLADLDIDSLGNYLYWTGTSGQPMFEPNGHRLYSSSGKAIVDGMGTGIGFALTNGSPACLIEGIKFQNLLRSMVQGGDRGLQTGGGTVLRNVIFTACGPLWLGGMHHRLQTVRFERSSTNALMIGHHPVGGSALPIDKPDENSVNDLVCDDLRFVNCGTTWAASSDNGVFSATRDLSGDLTVTNMYGTGCNGKGFYADDGFSDASIQMVWENNPGAAFEISGGARITMNCVDINSGVASVWNDKMSAASGQGSGIFHALFHYDGEGWTHTPYSGIPCSVNAYSRYQNTQNYFSDKTAFLARKTHFLSDFANEATFATSGTLTLTYSGTTPAPVNGQNRPTMPSGVTGRINGVSLAPA